MVFKQTKLKKKTLLELETPPFMENSILNFHFVFWITSLKCQNFASALVCDVFAI